MVDFLKTSLSVSVEFPVQFPSSKVDMVRLILSMKVRLYPVPFPGHKTEYFRLKFPHNFEY